MTKKSFFLNRRSKEYLDIIKNGFVYPKTLPNHHKKLSVLIFKAAVSMQTSDDGHGSEKE